MSPDVVIATTTSAAGPQENGKATDGSWQKKKGKGTKLCDELHGLVKHV